ncbi:3-oxoacyl-[acyl-carrier-protein] synthase 2 [mine drainage metagenome]|uniref:3-oxoacyl-[acyl-carrier-protein] synthase 2 n=1 Tax=mine drainage metagenome TaxID=410659 RepID=A0A1J5RHU7_9ZZZZ
MNKRRVVVTGLGVVACNGIGVDEFWRANLEGRSGVSLIDTFETDDFPSKVGGIVRGLEPARYMPAEVARRVDRFVHLGLVSAEFALQDSGLKLEQADRDRIGVIMGSGFGGAFFHEEQLIQGFDKGAHRLNPLAVPRITPNAVASQMGIRYGLRGPNMVISTACASAAHAIGEAFRKIQYGEIDACLTGGAEAPMTRFNFGAYCALRVLSKTNDEPTRASRPFDLTREGFVMAEGGAVLILEEREYAIRRGAKILAEVVGYASNSGAHHMVMPDPEGGDAARVMAAAIKDAGLTRVDYINAHATSTQANDAAETRAIKAVFGDEAKRIPVSSTKSMIGHSLGAAGAIEAVVCVKTLMHQIVPPTINLRVPDPACDLDYVPDHSREMRVRTVLSNSFGFGNCNASLVFAEAS